MENDYPGDTDKFESNTFPRTHPLSVCSMPKPIRLATTPPQMDLLLKGMRCLEQLRMILPVTTTTGFFPRREPSAPPSGNVWVLNRQTIKGHWPAGSQQGLRPAVEWILGAVIGESRRRLASGRRGSNLTKPEKPFYELKGLVERRKVSQRQVVFEQLHSGDQLAQAQTRELPLVFALSLRTE